MTTKIKNKRGIIIILPLYLIQDINMSIKDIMNQEINYMYAFDWEAFKVKGIWQDFLSDSVYIKIHHSELPEKREGEEYRKFTIESALFAFPFLSLEKKQLKRSIDI